jgi:hypothetical protein
MFWYSNTILSQMQRFNYDHKVPHHLSERFDKWFLHECVRIIPLHSQLAHMTPPQTQRFRHFVRNIRN